MREFANQKALVDYAERKGLVFVWAFGKHHGQLSPVAVFTKRQQLLSPDQYEIVDVRNPEPSVTDHQGELIPISAVCRRVDKFTDALPHEVFDALYFLARQKHLKEKLDAERTYATGAQLLLKLIEDRKAEWAKRNTAPLSD